MPWPRSIRFVAFLRELSVDLEGLDPADRAADRAVTREQAFLFASSVSSCWSTRSSRIALRASGVSSILGSNCAQSAPQALLLLAHGLLELLLA
jgi:hypothetical protein